MAEAGTISFKLTGDTSSFQAALAKATGSMKDTKAQTSELGSAFKKLGALVGGAAVVGAVKKFTDLARVQVMAEQKLAGAIAATGAAIDANSLKKYAADLQKVTTFGDEASIAASAMLVSFGMTEDQIKALLPKMQDFSAAMGVDLSTSARLFGRLVASGEADLTRYGVALSDTEKEMIKNGDAADRTALAVQLLDQRFGGMAQQLAKTDFGKYDQAMNDMGDSMEEIGKLIMPAMAKSFAWLSKKIQGFVRGIMVLAKAAAILSVEGFSGIKRARDAGEFDALFNPPAETGTEEGVKKGIQKAGPAIAKAMKKAATKGISEAKPEFDFDIKVVTGDVDLTEYGAAAREIEARRATLRGADIGGIKGPGGSVMSITAGKGNVGEEQKQLAEASKEAGGALRERFNTAIDAVGPALGNMASVAKAFTKGWKEGLTELAKQAFAQTKIAKVLAKAFNGFIKALADFMDILLPVAKAIGSVIGKVSGAITGAADWVGDKLWGSGKSIEEETRLREKSVKAMENFVEDMLNAAVSKNIEDKAMERFATGDLTGLSEETREAVIKVWEDELDTLRQRRISAELSGADTRVFDEEIDRISDAIGTGADVMDDTVSEISEQLTNVPQGLRVALNRFNATAAAGSSAAMGGLGSTPNVTPPASPVSIDNITVVTNDPHAFVNGLVEEEERRVWQVNGPTGQYFTSNF
jgi:hypothetical protein